MHFYTFIKKKKINCINSKISRPKNVETGGFSTQKQLGNHQEQQSGQRPYSCHGCHKGFYNNKSKHKHQKKCVPKSQN